MKAVISEKGQITVPKACRIKLGLSPGMQLDFQEVEGKLVGTKVQHTDPFRKWRGRGRLPAPMSVDEYIHKARA